MWVGYLLRKSLIPHNGKARTPSGSFTTKDKDSGIGHKGAGSFRPGFPFDPPDTPEEQEKEKQTYTSAMQSFDGIAGFS